MTTVFCDAKCCKSYDAGVCDKRVITIINKELVEERDAQNWYTNEQCCINYQFNKEWWVKMARLYDLTESYKNIADLLDDPTMDTEIISTALATISQDITLKAGNIAGLMKDMESDIAAVKAEEKRLAERRRLAENKITWLKGYIQEAMEATGQDKIKTPLWTFTLAKNPPSVIVNDMGQLPKKYVVETISQVPDKKAIKEAITAGEDVSGAMLTAGRSLRIK